MRQKSHSEDDKIRSIKFNDYVAFVRGVKAANNELFKAFLQRSTNGIEWLKWVDVILSSSLNITLAVFFLCWLAGCKKDKPDEHTLPNLAPGNIFVVCEGAYGRGNATLYSIPPARDTAYGDVFKSANPQSLGLGDVFQSMKKIGDKLFLCINSSDKIVVLNASDLKQTGDIQIPKPRYILPVSPTKAYVSSLYSNNVYIINTQTMQLTDSIILPYENTEGMCLYNGTAFITTWDTASDLIYKIDITTDKVIQPVKISGYAAQSVLIDKEQMLWVLAGNKTKGKAATLTRLDPFTGDVLTTYYFPKDADPLKPVFNNAKDTIYFIEVNYNGEPANNGIYRMGIHDANLPTQAFVTPGQYQYYWGLGIDPSNGNIYIGDPLGFNQKGRVMIYRQDGVLIRSFITGEGPGSFYFGE